MEEVGYVCRLLLDLVFDLLVDLLPDTVEIVFKELLVHMVMLLHEKSAVCND
jgi:hypothetical protein